MREAFTRTAAGRPGTDGGQLTVGG
jgi:hypothetical protein